jgi:hypothetical protein
MRGATKESGQGARGRVLAIQKESGQGARGRVLAIQEAWDDRWSKRDAVQVVRR